MSALERPGHADSVWVRRKHLLSQGLYTHILSMDMARPWLAAIVAVASPREVQLSVVSGPFSGQLLRRPGFSVASRLDSALCLLLPPIRPPRVSAVAIRPPRSHILFQRHPLRQEAVLAIYIIWPIQHLVQLRNLGVIEPGSPIPYFT